MSLSLFYSLRLCLMGGMTFFLLFIAYAFLVGRILSRPTGSVDARHVERTVGGAYALSGIGYLLWCIFIPLAHEGTDVSTVFAMLRYFDTLTFPIAILIGSTLVTHRIPRKRYIAAISVPIVVLALVELFSGAQWTLLAAQIWSALTIAAMIVLYARIFRRYHEDIERTYSNFEGRGINWFFWAIAPLFIDFLAFYFIPETALGWRLLFYPVEAACTLYIFTRLLRLKFSKQTDKQDDADAAAEEEPEAAEEEIVLTEEEAALHERIRAELERLNKEAFYLDSDLNMLQLAAMTGTNRTYLSRYLNKVEHATFYQYVNHLRLEHARRLIESGERPHPGKVWMESGFGNDTTFRQLFRKAYGCSPTDYAKQYGK